MSVQLLNDGESICPVCNGRMRVMYVECQYCNGTGKIGGYYILPAPSMVYNAFMYPRKRYPKNRFALKVESPSRFYLELFILAVAALVVIAALLYAVHLYNVGGSDFSLLYFLISTQQ